jgi:hypothetical protein
MSIAVFLENYGTGRRQFINAKSDISLPLVFVLKKNHEYLLMQNEHLYVCMHNGTL